MSDGDFSDREYIEAFLKAMKAESDNDNWRAKLRRAKDSGLFGEPKSKISFSTVGVVALGAAIVGSVAYAILSRRQSSTHEPIER